MILDLIRRARRRIFWNELFAAAAFGASLAMAGVVLLLLLGTELLDWRLLAAASVVCFAVPVFRIRRLIPSPYRAAILIDTRAQLQDAISTAFHFDQAENPGFSPEVRGVQKTAAEKLASLVALERLFPFRAPRALFAMLALTLVASSLFALRYGPVHRLDLRAPLTQVLFDNFGLNLPIFAKKDAARNKSLAKNRKADLLESLDQNGAGAEMKKVQGIDAAPDNALDTVGVPDANNDKAESASAKASGGQEAGEKGASEKTDSDGSESGSPPNSGKNSENPGGSREGPQQGDQSGGKPSSSSGDSSLLSKLRDAMTNIFSKSKSQTANSSGQKPSTAQGKGQSQAQQSGNEKGAPGQGQQGAGQTSAEAQNGDQAGDPQDGQNAPGKGAGKSESQQAAAQPGSGIGKQDGSKDLKAAEQLAAMGKLSEIIGKRSANVSGEMTVEVQSGPQQLRTAYSQRAAQHAESDSEVNRDEIPVALQAYVQQYFEEVRKQSAPPRGGAGKPGVKPQDGSARP